MTISKPIQQARRKAILVAALLAALPLLGAACGDGDSESTAKKPAAKETAAQKACKMVSEYVTQCGGGACDSALSADCSAVAGMLSDPVLEAVAGCIGGGTAPLSCLLSSLQGLQPSAAQNALVTQFCNECVSVGTDTCIQTFFSETSPVAEVRSVLLPLGDDLVNQIAAECTTANLCAATFAQCAQDVIAKRAIPEQTLTCVMNTLLDPGSVPPTPTCDALGSGSSASDSSASSGARTGAATSATSSSSSGSTTASASSSTSSGGGSCDGTNDCNTCFNCADAGPCHAVHEACNANPACKDLDDCILNCPTDACAQSCYDSYPAGQTDWLNFVDCYVCDYCYADCGGAASGC